MDFLGEDEFAVALPQFTKLLSSLPGIVAASNRSNPPHIFSQFSYKIDNSFIILSINVTYDKFFMVPMYYMTVQRDSTYLSLEETTKLFENELIPISFSNSNLLTKMVDPITNILSYTVHPCETKLFIQEFKPHGPLQYLTLWWNIYGPFTYQIRLDEREKEQTCSN